MDDNTETCSIRYLRADGTTSLTFHVRFDAIRRNYTLVTEGK